jgi:uncharacterized protein
MSSEILGRFVWHELLTTDTAAAAAFYTKVVPWRTAPSSMPGYTIWMAGQTQIGGLMALPTEPAATPPHWLIYIGTPNVDATCAQAQGLGARVVKVPADIPNVGRFAVLTDPQGATFALFTPGAGPPPGPQPTFGGFSWHELATTDVAAALRFYGQLFGWRKGAGHDMGAMGVYQIFEQGGEQVGGMCRPGSVQSAPSWLSYVHVADCGRAVNVAKGAGGRLLHGPMEVPCGSWIALMNDPQGGAFAVQEASRAASQPKPAAATPAAAPAKPAAAAAKSAAAPAKPAAAPAKPAAPSKPAAKPAAKAKKPKARKPKAKKPKAKKKAKKAARKAKRKATRKPARRKAPRKARSARRGARRAPKKRAARRRRRR